MKVIVSRKDLIRSLLLIKEDLEEKDRQKEMSKKINKISLDEKEEESEDPKADEEESEKKPEDSEKKKEKNKSDKELPGAEDLLSSSSQVPANVTSVEIIDKINKIRAGSSLKSKEVQNKIDSYITSLSKQEQENIWIYLDAMARIILAGSDPSEVPAPDSKSIEEPDFKLRPKNDFLPIVSPVVVGEGVKKSIRETDVPLRSGKLVPFGSKGHIKDIEMRIEDLERIRSYQERGSESRQALSIAINALRSELRSANRKNSSKTEDISE